MNQQYKNFKNWKSSKPGSNFLAKIDAQNLNLNSQSNASLENNGNQRSPSMDRAQKRPQAQANQKQYSRSREPYNKGKYYPQQNKSAVPECFIEFQLISDELFEISFRPGNPPSNFISVVREHLGRYNREMGAWEVSFSKYRLLFDTCKKITIPNKKVTLVPIATLPLEFYTEPIKLSKLTFMLREEDLNTKRSKRPVKFEIDYTNDQKHLPSELPKKFQEELYNFQRTGINFGINRDCRFLLADEMGVGKTIQAIGMCSIYREDWPVLIVCPSSLKLNWKDELLEWLKDIKPKDIQVLRKGSDNLEENAKFYIISYDLSIKMKEKLREKEFNFIVADESHYLKNRDAQRSKFLIPLIQKSKRVILISGTPILAKPVEAFSLLSILRPNIFKSFKDYTIRYCDPKSRPYGTDLNGSSHIRELHYILSKLMIRRLKKDVLSELPPKKRQKISIQPDSKILNQIRTLLAKGKSKFDFDNENILEKLGVELDEDSTTEEGKEENGATLFTKAYMLTGKSKIKGIKEYIKYLCDNDCKFLVFAHHIDVLDAIEEAVKDEKIGYMRIDGSTSINNRHDLVKKFQTDDKCLVAILSITACATGLTLTKASTVVFAELHYTPADIIQAEDRVHRIGQEHECVNIHYLVAPETIDDLIFAKLTQKMKVVTSTLDNKESDLGVQKIKDKIGEFTKGAATKKVKLDDYLVPSDNKGVKRDTKECLKKKESTEEEDFLDGLDDIENLFKL